MKMLPIKLPSVPRPRSPLARPLDPSYLSNVVAVAGSALATAAVFAYNLVAAAPLDVSPFVAGIAVFLAWAIGRELDPDRQVTAYLAMGTAMAVVLVVSPSLLFGVGVLIGVRLTAGTVGLALGRLDLLAIVAVGALLGSTAASVAAVAAIVVGTVIIDGASRRSRTSALAAVVAAAVVFSIRVSAFAPEVPALLDLILVAVLLAALAWSVPAHRQLSRTDWGDKSLSAVRVTAARVVTVVAVVLSLLAAGSQGLQAGFAVAGPPVVAVALTTFAARLRRTKNMLQPT